MPPLAEVLEDFLEYVKQSSLSGMEDVETPPCRGFHGPWLGI